MVTATQTTLDRHRFIHVTEPMSFAEQYYHIYNVRLKQARTALLKNSRDRWGNDIKNVPLEQLNASLGNEEVFVIGTLFKSMPRQPSILKELEESELKPVDDQTNYTSDEDTLILHETDENVQVVGEINPHEHVTGIPVSLKGYQLDGGAKFHVVDICYAGLNLSVYKPTSTNGNHKLSSPEKILIVSGLELSSKPSDDKKECDNIVSYLKKFRDFLLNDKDVTRVIIAGNSTSQKNRSESLELLDKYLFTLAQGNAEIDIMPGKEDPTSFLLPQQPFHPNILPRSGVLENVYPTTNPCLIIHKNLTILGTSGDNVQAIRQHSRIETGTHILKNTLEWGHLAPLAPDNLSCIPFKDNDPFVIDFIPDIYFAGNQPEYIVNTYCTENKPKIQFISVPKFVKTFSCVRIDLSSLEVEEINFTD